MAKRFSESSRWDDPWYRNLKPHLKNFWDFLCMRPDAAGVWKPDWEDIKFRIGVKIDPVGAINELNNGKLRVNILNNGYWQIMGWVEFQFGEILNEKIGQHRASIALINKYREFGYLEGKSYPIPYPTHGLINSPVEMEKEKEITIQPIFKYLDDVSFVACFNDYLEMRKKIRKPATDRAKELALKSLHEHPLETAIKMLNNSVMNSWQGIFPLKQERVVEFNKTIKSSLPSVKYEDFKPSPKPDPKQQEEVHRLMQETLKNLAVVK